MVCHRGPVTQSAKFGSFTILQLFGGKATRAKPKSFQVKSLTAQARGRLRRVRQDEINEALEYLAEGEGLRASEAFKDAVNKYKDALSKAESAAS